MSRPLVYLGRAIDGRAEPDFYGWAQRTESLLLAAGLESVDPVLLYSQAAETEVDPFDRVRSDLEYLKRADVALIDISIPGWQYVGCICELVYASRWSIPTVVVADGTDLGDRLWIRYHATVMAASLEAAVKEVSDLVGDTSKRG